MPMLFLKEKPLGNFKGVLFDKDGTLSNSEPYLLSLAERRIEESIKQFYKFNSSKSIKFELKKLLKSAYGVLDTGLNPNGILAVASKQQNIATTATIFCLLGASWPKALDIANSVFETIYNIEKKSSTTKKNISPLPGAIDLLSRLHKAGLKCALISNDSDLGITNFLTENKLIKTMSVFWSADSHPSKPDPNAVKLLCNSINLVPAECVLIGDSDLDMKMGREAGVGITLGYTSGWLNKPCLTAHQFLIHHWSELTVGVNPKVKAI